MVSIQHQIESQSFKKAADSTIAYLKQHYAEGNLDVEDFEERVEQACSASEKKQLVALIKDLPSPTRPYQTEIQTPSGNTVDLNRGMVRDQQNFVNVFSGTEKKGVWRPARSLNLVNVFGGAQLDFRKAEFAPEGTTIKTTTIFGGAEIIVPRGMNVDVNVVPIFGGVEDRTRGIQNPEAPTIRIRGLLLFGGMEIRERD
jgi:predicted membrane protein